MNNLVQDCIAIRCQNPDLNVVCLIVESAVLDYNLEVENIPRRASAGRLDPAVNVGIECILS